MIHRFYSVAVVVSDANKAAEWYKEKLGFEVVEKMGHWITVAPKGSGTVLHLCQGPPLEPGNTGILFLCEDVVKTVEELKKKGVKITKEPKDEGFGIYAMFSDPDGNVFWLMQE
ncbi:MAG TPA: VOC family protein [Geobacterales bacterium]|nr:VOC family protein [Geobacterales bacterium]